MCTNETRFEQKRRMSLILRGNHSYFLRLLYQGLLNTIHCKRILNSRCWAVYWLHCQIECVGYKIYMINANVKHSPNPNPKPNPPRSTKKPNTLISHYPHYIPCCRRNHRRSNCCMSKCRIIAKFSKRVIQNIIFYIKVCHILSSTYIFQLNNNEQESLHDYTHVVSFTGTLDRQMKNPCMFLT